MKIQFTILFCLFLSILVGNAQSKISKEIEIKKEISNYCIDTNRFSSITYKLLNKGDETVWLWIEKMDISHLTDSAIIKGYFFQIKGGGDASLYQLGMDRNVEGFIPGIFDSFIKCISSKNCFTIQIISNQSISEFQKQEVFYYLDNHIVAFTEKDMLKYIPFLSQMSPIVFFKSELIVIYLDMLCLQ